MVVAATSNVTGEVRYKAYGETRHSWGITDTTKYHFTGQRQESTIGLYFYNARWYDAALGRFVQADALVPEADALSDWASAECARPPQQEADGSVSSRCRFRWFPAGAWRCGAQVHPWSE
jgi:RHS repeat-associated protein